MTAQTRAVGVLAPRDEIRLAFKVGGVVDSVRVESGDIVRKGQVLAELKRAEVDAAVSQAAEGVEKARRDLERARQLRIDEVATEEQVQDLTTAYNVARSNLDAARFNARFARIEAPADGIVLRAHGRRRRTGAARTAGDRARLDRLGLGRARRPRRPRRGARGTGCAGTGDVRRVPGSRVRGQGDAHRRRRRPHDGHVRGRSRSRSRRARASRAGWWPRSTLPLAPLPDVASSATVVPVTALVDADGQRATVYVLDREQNVARRKEVTLGPLLGEQVIVTAGLIAGEPVITDGAAWLTDGRSVRVVTDDRG